MPFYRAFTSRIRKKIVTTNCTKNWGLKWRKHRQMLFITSRPTTSKVSQGIFSFLIIRRRRRRISLTSCSVHTKLCLLSVVSMTKFYVHLKRNFFVKNEELYNLLPFQTDKMKMNELPPKGESKSKKKERSCTFEFSDVNRNIVAMASLECQSLMISLQGKS